MARCQFAETYPRSAGIRACEWSRRLAASILNKMGRDAPFARSRRGRLRYAIVALVLAAAAVASAADYTLQIGQKAPPKETGESIRAVLQPKAIQLMNGDKAALEIWLRQEIPLKSKPASPKEALGAVGETTLMGVVAIQESLQDYKGNDIPKGTYTARLGLQPQDGDHLGTAEFPYFLVLIPADSDKELGGIDKFRPMVKASGKAIASGHPAVLSLRPADPGGKIPRLDEPAPEHNAIRLEVPGAAEGTKSPIVFDVVYRGKGHA